MEISLRDCRVFKFARGQADKLLMKIIPLILSSLLLVYCGLADNYGQQDSIVVTGYEKLNSATESGNDKKNKKTELRPTGERRSSNNNPSVNNSKDPGIIVVSSDNDCRDRYIRELENYNDCIDSCEFSREMGTALYDKCSGTFGQCGFPPHKPLCIGF